MLSGRLSTFDVVTNAALSNLMIYTSLIASPTSFWQSGNGGHWQLVIRHSFRWSTCCSMAFFPGMLSMLIWIVSLLKAHTGCSDSDSEDDVEGPTEDLVQGWKRFTGAEHHGWETPCPHFRVLFSSALCLLGKVFSLFFSWDDSESETY